MPPGSDPATERRSPGFRLNPSILIVADSIVVVSAVMKTSMSVTDIAGPPAVYVAAASAPSPEELLASRSSPGGATVRFVVTSMKDVLFLLQDLPSKIETWIRFRSPGASVVLNTTWLIAAS